MTKHSCGPGDSSARALHARTSWLARPIVAFGRAVLVGALILPMAQPAYADVATGPYNIGVPTDAVNSVMVSPSAAVAGAATSFEVKFRLTSPLLGSVAGTWVSVIPSISFGSVPRTVSVLDDTSATCVQSGPGGARLGASVVTVNLGSNCSAAPGDDLEVDFTAVVPANAHSFYFSVTTSANSSSAASNSVTTTSSPPTFSTSSQALGTNATYSIEDASWTGLNLSQSFTMVQLSAGATLGTTFQWYDGQAGYSVEVTTAAGVSGPDEVLSATLGPVARPSEVTLVLISPVAIGDSLTVTAKGTNPVATSSDRVLVTPETDVGGSATPAGAGEATNAVLFGTSVSSPTVAVSPPGAHATATYTVGFQVTTPVTGGAPGASICLGEAAGPTNFATEGVELVTDTTAGWHFAASGTTYPAGNPPANAGCDAFDNGAVISVPTGYDIRAGDTLTIVLVDVTNPPMGTVSDFSVSTSSDTVAARAAPYVLEENAVAGVLVTVTPSTTGALAAYTISGLVATSAMDGGSTTLTLEGPAGTVFPDAPSYYGIVDLTNPSGTGTVNASVSGGGTSTVAIVVPDDIEASDHLLITVQDAINPASAGGSDTVTVLGPVTGRTALSPFPRANSSYPNGAIVDFAGTDYVFAGGHAFGVASPSALYAVEKVDRAEPGTAAGGAAPPSVPARPGTLLSTRSINGNPTVYVAGRDGELHGFATPAQLVSDGYDTALIVTVPSLRSVSVGAPVGRLGAAAKALATGSDGAVADSAGAWYVFAGGRAFPVTGASVAALRRLDKAVPQAGSVTAAQQSASLASGVLVSASGVVYVSYQGQLWPFKSPAQLAADGYGGTAAVPVPGHPSVTTVSAYSGS
jgi:hypothetical protein